MKHVLTKLEWDPFAVYVDVRSSRWALQVSYGFVSYTSIKEKENHSSSTWGSERRGEDLRSWGEQRAHSGCQ